MADIIRQLGIDSTFFVQFGVICVAFLLLSQVYFKPFLKIIELRHRRTVEDREAAEKLMVEADRKLQEYQSRIAGERETLRQHAEEILAKARSEEARLIASAREEAKKVTQEAMDAVEKQRSDLRNRLAQDVESFAQQIADTLVKS